MKRRRGDFSQIAFQVVRESTGQAPKFQDQPARPKNPAAVALGRLGGLKGGKARAATLSARKRSQLAAKAAKNRWSKARKSR